MMVEISIKMPPTISLGKAYERGWQCGEIEANEVNCHFSIFATPQHTKEWERGKADALENAKRPDPISEAG